MRKRLRALPGGVLRQSRDTNSVPLEWTMRDELVCNGILPRTTAPHFAIDLQIRLQHIREQILAAPSTARPCHPIRLMRRPPCEIAGSDDAVA